MELILAERGIAVSRRRPTPGDIWHLGEVFLRINGKLRYLWRAVDQHGVVLDILVQGAGMSVLPSGSSGACWLA